MSEEAVLRADARNLTLRAQALHALLFSDQWSTAREASEIPLSADQRGLLSQFADGGRSGSANRSSRKQTRIVERPLRGTRDVSSVSTRVTFACRMRSPRSLGFTWAGATWIDSQDQRDVRAKLGRLKADLRVKKTGPAKAGPKSS